MTINEDGLRKNYDPSVDTKRVYCPFCHEAYIFPWQRKKHALCFIADRLESIRDNMHGFQKEE